MLSHAHASGKKIFRTSFDFLITFPVCFTNVGLSETFSMKSVTAHYYLTSSEALRTRTMRVVSRNDEEGFVWIIPWYSDYNWVAS